MLSQLSTLSSLNLTSLETSPTLDSGDDAIRQAARDFEASYIAQMLTFSGLDKALTMGGGGDMSAFTSFYIESFAEQIADNGGFGLAEKFYDRIDRKSVV